MKDTEKTKEQLIEELAELRQRVGELEAVKEENQPPERKQAEEGIRLHEIHLENLLDLHRMEDATEKEILDYVLEASLRNAQSAFAFIGLMSANETVMTIHAWSKGAMEQCALTEKPIRFPIAEAGLWGEAVRKRHPIIVNDYDVSTEVKKGYPQGHVPIKRYLGIPIFSEDRIVAVAAVANKESEYTESDIRPLTSLFNEMWNLLERKRTEETLKVNLALQRVRNEVLQMEEEDDWEKVVLGFYGEVEQLVGFHDCSLNFVDQQNDRVVLYVVDPNYKVERKEAPIPSVFQRVIETGQYMYRSNRTDALFGEDIPADIHSIIDIPFMGGTLAVNSTQENAFSERDIQILQQFCQVMSEAHRRLQDITERKQAEDALRKQTRALQERTKELNCLYQLSQLVWQRDTSFAEILKGTVDLLPSGWQYPENVGVRIVCNEQEVRTDNFRETLWKQSADITANRKHVGVVEICYLEEKPEEDDGPFLKEERALIEGIAAELGKAITHSQMEQELIRLERLRAVGELSAGVSHNLNNILTTVLGPAQILKRKTNDPELLREVNDIITSATRARDLVHELHLSVRTQGEESLTPVSVDQIVQQAVQTSRPRWKDEPEAQGISIEMVTRWGGVPSIQGTEAGLHDILTNFIFNAVDAMPGGGAISIRTETVEDQVQITFSDTGTGMDEETKKRIFEPFFTTKMDIGTGLGLSTVYGTVNRWGGTIKVDSTSGKGTTFTLRFPVWTEEIVAEEGKAAVQSTRPGNILVVDDDKTICSLLSRLLGEHHEVESVNDGQQALELFAPGKYDVVLVDMGMPGMAGNQVAQELVQVDPSVGLVLITGWDIEPDDSRMTLLADDPRLTLFDFQVQKPFTDLDEVEDVVARAIEVHDQRAEEAN